MATVYKGPKPRAYSSLSKKDKAKEDRQNTIDAAAKKDFQGRNAPKPKSAPAPKKGAKSATASRAS